MRVNRNVRKRSSKNCITLLKCNGLRHKSVSAGTERRESVVSVHFMGSSNVLNFMLLVPFHDLNDFTNDRKFHANN